MGYAKHVGRVGALAVALGIGAAVATTPGVAWADGETDTNVEAPSNPEPPSGEGAAGTTTPPTEHQDPGEVIRRNIERAADDLRNGIRSAISGVVRSSGGAITSTHRNGSNTNNGNVPPVIVEGEGEPVSNPEPKDEQKPTTFVADNNAAVNPVRSFTAPRWRAPQAQSHGETAPKPLAKAIDDGKDVLEQTINSATGNHPGTGSLEVQRNAFSTLDTTETEEQQQVRPSFVAPVAIITNVLNAALAPFLNPTPGQPAPQNPILWAVLAFVRRQLQDTPFGKIVLNRAPVSGDQDIDPVTGTDHQVVDVNATDPDGDDVHTVSATNGAHGTTTINDDGTVTYDPTDTYEGTDTFYVTVSDEGSGFHLHGLGGLLGSAGHTTTIPVTVLVSREDQSPVQVDPNTGKATKEVTLREGVVDDPRTLIGTKYPSQYGVAEITGYDEETRQYTITFTPDANLRLANYAAAPNPQPVSAIGLFSARRAAAETFAAAAVGPPQYDTVTVTVGEPPNEQTFSFEVPITPARLRLNPDDLTVGTVRARWP